MRRQLMLGLAMIGFVAVLEPTGCADPCDEAIDLCLDCDLDASSCAERFQNASREQCEAAVDQYRRNQFCVVDRGDCSDDPQPVP